MRTELSDGVQTMPSNLIANKSFDSHGGQPGFSGQGERLYTDNHAYQMSVSPMQANGQNLRGQMPGRQRIYFGGNVSMQSSNDAMSQQPYNMG